MAVNERMRHGCKLIQWMQLKRINSKIVSSACYNKFSCCCSVTKSCLALCNPMECSTPDSPSSTITRSLLKLMSIELVMLSNLLILCCLLLLLPSIFPSIRVFSNESALCIRWPKCWIFSFSISLSDEYSWLISLNFMVHRNLLASTLKHRLLGPTTTVSHSVGLGTKYLHV